MSIMNIQKYHKLYELLMDSYNRSISNGMCIFDWVKKIKELGCVITPSPKNMMMASIGRCITPERQKIANSNNFISVTTNSFGTVYIPKELAFKVITMGFFP